MLAPLTVLVLLARLPGVEVTPAVVAGRWCSACTKIMKLNHRDSDRRRNNVTRVDDSMNQ
jgi:hypothetical protein